MGGTTNNTGGGTTTPNPNANQPSWAGGGMGGGGTVQNWMEAPATKQFGGQILSDTQKMYTQGPKPFAKSLYAGMGDTTKQGLASLLGMDTSVYSGGLSGAMSDYADVAAGNQIGRGDANYDRLRSKLMSDISGDVNSTFSNSGRFGGGSHVTNLTEGLADSVAAMDYGQLQDSYARQGQAVAGLPGILQAMMMPSQTQLGVGQMYDADAQAKLSGENDLFRRTNDAGLNHIADYLNVLQGGSGEDGVLTPDAPWWQQALGTGVGLLGSVLGGGS